MKLVRGEDGVRRCPWGASKPDYVEYHDEEWGMPAVRDAILFEKICLEGFQAGLSWLTILRKRPDFRDRCDFLGTTVTVSSLRAGFVGEGQCRGRACALMGEFGQPLA